jgi:hypothetical protein
MGKQPQSRGNGYHPLPLEHHLSRLDDPNNAGRRNDDQRRLPRESHLGWRHITHQYNRELSRSDEPACHSACLETPP